MPELSPKTFGRLVRTIGDGSLRLHGKDKEWTKTSGGDGPAPSDRSPGYAELLVTCNSA